METLLLPPGSYLLQVAFETLCHPNKELKSMAQNGRAFFTPSEARSALRQMSGNHSLSFTLEHHLN